MPSSDVVIVGFARTPFGRFFGRLQGYSAHTLAAVCIDQLMRRTGIPATAVDGLYAGVGMAAGGVFSAARQAVLASALSDHTPSVAVDRACCSGMTALGLARREILLGEADLLLCGGFESLSRTPLWASRKQRTAPGDPDAWSPEPEVYDPLLLRSPDAGKAIAEYTGDEAVARGVGREMQDDWAAQSHARYFAAERSGYFLAERISLPELDSDEGPRAQASTEKLARLATIYSSPTITAGNAPGLSDGAAFLALASVAKAHELGLDILARLSDYVNVADGPTSGSYTPALGIQSLLERSALCLQDLELLEINEAYAATPLVSTLFMSEGDVAAAEVLRAKTNLHGGAVAIGHPLGASGARIVMTLASALRKRGGGCGAAAICGGFGQGDAVLVEVDG